MKFCKHELLAQVFNTSFGKRMHLLFVYPTHKSKSTTRMTRTLVKYYLHVDILATMSLLYEIRTRRESRNVSPRNVT